MRVKASEDIGSPAMLWGFWQWEAYGRSHDLKSLRMTRNFWGTLLWLVAGIAGMIFTCFQKTSHTQPQRIAMLQDVAGQLPKIAADLLPTWHMWRLMKPDPPVNCSPPNSLKERWRIPMLPGPAGECLSVAWSRCADGDDSTTWIIPWWSRREWASDPSYPMLPMAFP